MITWIKNKFYNSEYNNLEEEVIKTEKTIDQLNIKTTEGRENLYSIFKRALIDTENLIEITNNEITIIENHRQSLKSKINDLSTEKYKMENFRTNLEKLFKE